jgi:hypothetical protein
MHVEKSCTYIFSVLVEMSADSPQVTTGASDASSNLYLSLFAMMPSSLVLIALIL